MKNHEFTQEQINEGIKYGLLAVEIVLVVAGFCIATLMIIGVPL